MFVLLMNSMQNDNVAAKKSVKICPQFNQGLNKNVRIKMSNKHY